MSLKWRRVYLLRFVFIIAVGSTFTLVDSSKNKTAGENERLQLAYIGSSAKIICSFETFHEHDVVQWSHGEKMIIAHQPVKNEEDNIYTTENIENTASLIIKNITYHNAGGYKCKKVTSVGGRWVVQNWLLIVQDGPFLESITTVMETESISATCCVEFSHAVNDVKYLWSIDNPIFITNRSSDTVAPRVHICSNVSITAKRSYHNKMLECTIANELNVSSHRRVTVMYPATAVWESPEESTTPLIVENNTYINITCVYDGFPPPNITLQKHNADLEIGWINTNSFPEPVGRNDTHITVTFLYYFSSENSSERLRCFASNNLSDTQGGHGVLVEAFIPAMVVILSGPRFSHVGDNITITCASYGRPMPDVSLQKNVVGEWETVNEVSPTKNATTNPLQLIWEFRLVVNSADTGEYRCHANNTIDTFDDSSALPVEISISFYLFIQQNIQTAVCLLIGVLVIIIVITGTICQRRNSAQHFRPTIRRYRGIIRNSLHFGNDSNPIPNVPDICQNVGPLPPDTSNIPVSGRGNRDELLETYEELPDKGDNEEHLVNPLLSSERVNYAVVQKKRIDQQTEMKNENNDVTFNQCEESASYSVLRPKC
ncbi:neural cell adhesion molecule 1-B-like isoform X2 [Apostichopus japonicus]|uniref:neural cell adhesion molecule 1-B-like isoform X2 n=1 Tax=Stichopus japonicus TaxID=307972 RepID=UPI003AB8EED4